MVWTSTRGAAALTIAAAAATWWSAVAVALLLAALTIFDVVDAVWSIARQGLVAELAAPEVRGFAMNMYGAFQRLGRIVGPLFASAVLLVAEPQAVLPVAAVILLLAIVMFSAFKPECESAPKAAAPQEQVTRAGLVLRLILMGAGALGCSCSRRG